MDDFDFVVEELLAAIGETPEIDHGAQNCSSEVKRTLYNLRSSSLVAQPSFVANLRAILGIKGRGKATQGQIARMLDRFAEFRVAERFLNMTTSARIEGLLLEFSEAPDIHVTVGSKGLHFGVEVKRPRLRAQDRVDAANMRELYRKVG